MAWPNPPDYNEAVQNPQHCFADPDLRGGKPVLNALGLPWPRSGNSADVYQIIDANDKAWAVKCFTREVHGLHERYQAISDFLQEKSLPFMVKFFYLDQGILIRGQWYPVVKMRWVDGLTLNDLLREFVDKPLILERMAQMWVRLAQEMRSNRIIHGDLQHGNVLMVPHKQLVKLRLRLIDYDGMTVPTSSEQLSGELGHPNFQHPQRLRDGTRDAEVDRFAHLVIYTAIRAVACAGKALWDRFDNGENLLFREQDFQELAKSALFKELTKLEDPEVRAISGHLLLASQRPLDRVPLLDELLADGKVIPLSVSQRDEVEAILTGKTFPLPPAVEEEVEVELITSRTQELLVNAEGMAIATGRRLRGFGSSITRVAANPRTTMSRLVGKARHWPRWLQGVAAAGVLSGGLMTITLFFAVLSLAFSPARPPQEPINLPPSVARMPEMQEIEDDVALQRGETQVLPIEIDRRGNGAAILVEAHDLPDGVICPKVLLTANQTVAVLKITAALDAPESARDVHVTAIVDGKPAGTQTVAVSVLKPAITRLLYTRNVIMGIADKQSILIGAQRGKYQGPIELSVEELPEGMTAKTSNFASGQDSVALELSTTVDAKDTIQEIQVIASVGEDILWQGPITVSVQRPTGIRLLAIPDLAIKPGETQPLKLAVIRHGYEGPIDLKMRGLPDGMSCPPVTVAGTTGLATMELSSAAELAVSGERELVVVASVGKEVFDKQSFNVTIPDTTPYKVTRENVKFATHDGVHLWGTWYRGSKGKESPCALLMHNLPGHRKLESWDRLAQALQKQGYAVLAFDFRGHGDSTTVEPYFWTDHANRELVRPAAGSAKDTIKFTDFSPAYYPVLANDIMAARMFLDRLNDEGKCNSAHVVLVGAEQSAALATLWLRAECARFQVQNLRPLRLEPASEGKCIACAVCLNLTDKLGERTLPIADWLRLIGRERKVPIAFVYGADDATAASEAKGFVRTIDPDSNNLKGTLDIGIRATAFKGQELLEKEADTQLLVMDYIQRTMKDRPTAFWSERGGDLKSYLWLLTNAPPFPVAKNRGAKSMNMLPLKELGVR